MAAAASFASPRFNPSSGTNTGNAPAANPGQQFGSSLNATEDAELFREAKRQFALHLFDDSASSFYSNVVQKELIGKANTRLIININHLRAKLPDKANA